MKQILMQMVKRITAFLNRLGEDYEMDFVDDWMGGCSKDVFGDYIEDGLFA